MINLSAPLSTDKQSKCVDEQHQQRKHQKMRVTNAQWLPLPWSLLARVLMVTNSSAADGWMPTVMSKWDFLAPAFRAMAIPCIISGASGPTMWTPMTCRRPENKWEHLEALIFRQKHQYKSRLITVMISVWLQVRSSSLYSKRGWAEQFESWAKFRSIFQFTPGLSFQGRRADLTSSVSACTIIFISVLSSRPVSVFFRGLNFET